VAPGHIIRRVLTRTLIVVCSLVVAGGTGCLGRRPTASSNPGTTAAGAAAQRGRIEVALTVDDLPRHGTQIPGK